MGKPLSDIALRKSLKSSLFAAHQQILCKTFSASDFRKDSEFVYKTVALGLASPAGACVTATHLALSPLRLISARTPVSESFSTSTQTYLETLECGHQVFNYSEFHWDEKGHLINTPPKAKRRRCSECAEIQLALKFKPESVTSPRKKRVA